MKRPKPRRQLSVKDLADLNEFIMTRTTECFPTATFIQQPGKPVAELDHDSVEEAMLPSAMCYVEGILLGATFTLNQTK